MSTFAPVFQAIREQVATVATSLDMPVVHDNAPEPAKALTWARLTVQVDDTRQASMGAPVRFRSRGAAVLNISTRAEKGDATLLAACDALCTAFRGLSLASPEIRFDSPTPTGATVVDGAWFTRTVRIPFIADTYQT